MQKASSTATRRLDRKEEVLARLQSLIEDVDAHLVSVPATIHIDWWNEISSLLRAGLGQDAEISRGFESARSAFYRARSTDDRRSALATLKSALGVARVRLAAMTW